MGRALAVAVCAASAALLGGCMDQLRSVGAGSLKDDAPRAALAAPERVKASEFSVIDRAKAEQAARCGQRHVDYAKGTLRETDEQKRVADAACSELHKYDYVH
jgi:hypothetical protein